MFTKKHYIGIAQALKDCKNFCANNPDTTGEDCISYLTGYLSESFKRDNPNFSSDKFKEFINK